MLIPGCQPCFPGFPSALGKVWLAKPQLKMAGNQPIKPLVATVGLACNSRTRSSRTLRVDLRLKLLVWISPTWGGMSRFCWVLVSRSLRASHRPLGESEGGPKDEGCRGADPDTGAQATWRSDRSDGNQTIGVQRGNWRKPSEERGAPAPP